MTLTLTSHAFDQGEGIPKKYSCEGDDVSPGLRWAGVPEGTKSLLLVCDDPDAPGGTFHHWAVYNIPPDRDGLPEGFGPESLEGGLRQAVNDFGRPGYGGPCPPRGHGLHHYHFRLSALSEPNLPVGPDASCVEVQEAARPYEISFVELVGTYER